jgi:hypothetical protein
VGGREGERGRNLRMASLSKNICTGVDFSNPPSSIAPKSCDWNPQRQVCTPPSDRHRHRHRRGHRHKTQTQMHVTTDRSMRSRQRHAPHAAPYSFPPQAAATEGTVVRRIAVTLAPYARGPADSRHQRCSQTACRYSPLPCPTPFPHPLLNLAHVRHPWSLFNFARSP